MSLSNTDPSVEVFVLDTPRAASVALGVARAGAESTHVLCRHQAESTPDFARRVLRRIDRIQRDRRVRSLWYVVGSEAAAGRGSVPLLQSILAALESGSSLTVVGPGSRQSAVFDWIDSITHQPCNVTVRAQLYADEAEALRAPAREQAHSPHVAAQRSAPASVRESLMPRMRWLAASGGGRWSSPHGTHLI